MENFEAKIVDIQPAMFNQFVVQYGQIEQKHIAFYMYRDD